MKLYLVPCSNAEVEVLANLSKRTFKDAFEKDNNPNDFNTYLSTSFDVEVLQSELKDPDTSFYLVYKDVVLVAYFKLNENGPQTDVKDANAIEIERIYVEKEYQGQGIGEWMLGQIISMARTKNKNYVWLGVWELNTKAIKFYERSGFYKYGTHPYYIGKDKQTDWLMRLDL